MSAVALSVGVGFEGRLSFQRRHVCAPHLRRDLMQTFEALVFVQLAVEQVVEVAIDEQFLLVEVNIVAVLSAQVSRVVGSVRFLNLRAER